MSLINRDNKGSSGTDNFLAGTPAVADEVDGDIDKLFNEINGELNNANIKDSAGIEPGKIADFSSNTSDARTETDPGSGAVPSGATDLEGEIANLRYALSRHSVGVAADFQDSADVTVGGTYHEPPIVGRNLLRNGNLQSRAAAANSLPDGWEEDGWTIGVDAPTVTFQAAPATDGALQDEMTFTADLTTAQGIKQVVTNIKASTKYLIGARMRQTVNPAHLVIAGAEAGGQNYQDFDYTEATGTYGTVTGIVQSLAGATDITVSVVTDGSGGAGDEFEVTQVWMYEMNPDPVPSHDGYTQVQTLSTNEDIVGPDGWKSTTFTLTANPAGWNQKIVVTGLLNTEHNGSNQSGYRLGEEIDGGGVVYVQTGKLEGQTHIYYVEPEPVPGSAYVYTIEVYRLTIDVEISPADPTLGQLDSVFTVSVE